MNQYLLFRLYGPMASWGDIAVGERRPSQTRPTRSAVLGLLAAALGIRREDEPAIQQLSKAIVFAARLDLPGDMLHDYHTIQAPSQKKNQVFKTRRDELNKPNPNTIVSRRDYRTDSGSTIALKATEPDKDGIHKWQSALQRPALPLYLGRKSCPLALPTVPTVIEAKHFADAFAQYPGCETQMDAGNYINPGAQVHFLWEGDDTSLKGQVNMTTSRHDQLISRQRWQFQTREEHQSSFPRSEAPIANTTNLGE